jgi:hypothetical protein
MPNNIHNSLHNKLQNNRHTKPSNGAMRSKHRLAEISHHFLSNEDERLPTWNNTIVIPVLLGSQNDDYIVYELNRAFNQQNSSSMVLNIENRLAVADNLAALASQQATDADTNKHDQESNLPDYCLVPASSPSTTLALQCNRVIIAVHASLRGVRIAYDQLAFMATLDTDFDVCVIMLGAKNKSMAKRFFGFLYNNAQSLLSLKLECGGYLLHEDKQESSPTNEVEEAELEEAGIATDFSAVAAGILKKFNPQKTAHISSAQLSAPAGVAVLLS